MLGIMGRDITLDPSAPCRGERGLAPPAMMAGIPKSPTERTSSARSDADDVSADKSAGSLRVVAIARRVLFGFRSPPPLEVGDDEEPHQGCIRS